MDENKRAARRFSVSLYAEHVDPESAPLLIRDLSATGFLIRGDICAGQGGILHASFRVHPSSGETHITARGRVMRCRIAGPDSEFGVEIEGFGSPEEERAYRDYVLELESKSVS